MEVPNLVRKKFFNLILDFLSILKDKVLLTLTVFIFLSCSDHLKSEYNNYSNRFREASRFGNYITPGYSVDKAGHMQGIVQYDSCMFFVFTHLIVKINSNLQVENTYYNKYHLGSPAIYYGLLYIPVEKGGFNNRKPSDSYVFVFNPDEITIINEIKVDETIHGLGGIAYGDNKFLLIGGNLYNSKTNYIYEYDTSMSFVQGHKIYSGKTDLGFQTITYNNDLMFWELSGYNSHENGNSKYSSFVLDKNLQILGSLHGIDMEPSNYGLSHDIENLHFIGQNYNENNMVYAVAYKDQPLLINPFSLFRLKKLNEDKPIIFSRRQILALNEKIENLLSISFDVKLSLNNEEITDYDYFLLGGHDSIYSSNSLHAAFSFVITSQGKGQFKFILNNESNNQAILFSDHEITVDSGNTYRLIATYNGSSVNFFIDDKLHGQINMNGSLQDFSEFTVGPTASVGLESELYNINIMNDVLVN
jgi:hypothetical protein